MSILSWDERWTTFALEMIALGLMMAIGVAYTMDSWPEPHIPILWAASVLVAFLCYRGFRFAYRRLKPPKTTSQSDARANSLDDHEGGEGPSLKWSAVEPNLVKKSPNKLHIPADAGEFSDPEGATIFALEAVPQSPADARTIQLDAAAIRPETPEDLSTPKPSAIPLFAESAMSTEQRTQVLEAIKKTDEKAEPSSIDAQSPTVMLESVDAPTEMTASKPTAAQEPDAGPTALLETVESVEQSDDMVSSEKTAQKSADKSGEPIKDEPIKDEPTKDESIKDESSGDER